MGGDHMGGLALAIMLAMGCMLLVGALTFGSLGYFALRKTRYRWLGAVLAALLGVGAGALAVTATFYETTWDPPNQLVIDVPAGFHRESIVIIADASKPKVDRSGASLPFVSRAARIRVPASGVVRVCDIDWIYGEQVEARLSTGASIQGLLVFNAEPGLGDGLVYDLVGYDSRLEPALADVYRTPAFAERIRAREAAR